MYLDFVSLLCDPTAHSSKSMKSSKLLPRLGVAASHIQKVTYVVAVVKNVLLSSLIMCRCVCLRRPEASGPLQLELQPNLGAGNRTRILCKSSECF